MPNSDNLTQIELDTNRFLESVIDATTERLTNELLAKAREGDGQVNAMVRLAEQLGLSSDPSELFIEPEIRRIAWRPVAEHCTVALIQHMHDHAVSRGDDVCCETQEACRDFAPQIVEMGLTDGVAIDGALGEQILAIAFSEILSHVPDPTLVGIDADVMELSRDKPGCVRVRITREGHQ